MNAISPQECCQRGASWQGNGREVNCRRDFQSRLFFQNLTANKVALKTFTFQPDSFQCKIAFKGGEMPDNGELQTFMHFQMII